jgi:hypothetical protein
MSYLERMNAVTLLKEASQELQALVAALVAEAEEMSPPVSIKRKAPELNLSPEIMDKYQKLVGVPGFKASFASFLDTLFEQYKEQEGITPPPVDEGEPLEGEAPVEEEKPLINEN